jgi:hypothetical protein
MWSYRESTSATSAVEPTCMPCACIFIVYCVVRLLHGMHPRGGLWTLQQVALQRTKLRVLHLVWSRATAHELVYALEDGSLHLLRLRVDTASSSATASWGPAQVRLAANGEPCMLLDLCTRSSDLLHMLESRL